MTNTSPRVALYPAVAENSSPLISLTTTECFQDNNWLVAKSPFPALVGAQMSMLPSSRRVLVGRTSKNCLKRFTPMSKLVGSGLPDVMPVSSSSLANRARWSRLSNPQIIRCNIFSINVAIPIVHSAPFVVAPPFARLVPVAARVLLLLRFVSWLENLLHRVFLEQLRSHVHGGVARVLDGKLLPRTAFVRTALQGCA